MTATVKTAKGSEIGIGQTFKSTGRWYTVIGLCDPRSESSMWALVADTRGRNAYISILLGEDYPVREPD
jgi:hypothetical protein